MKKQEKKHNGREKMESRLGAEKNFTIVFIILHMFAFEVKFKIFRKMYFVVLNTFFSKI
jgi:hypothetical protein